MQRRNLEYFVAVVDCGSISAAEQKLLVAQPSLSRTINAMEKEMDCQLLDRTGRGVTPTATGRQLYYYARSILDKFQMLERLYHDGDTQLVSRLHLSVAMLFLKDSLLETFYHQLHTPEAELSILETTLEPLIEQVAEGTSELGLAVVNDHQLPLFTRMSQARGLELTDLDEGRDSCVHIHTSHPLAQYSRICCRQLFEYPRILPPDDLFGHLNQTVRYEAGRPAAPSRSTTIAPCCTCCSTRPAIWWATTGRPRNWQLPTSLPSRCVMLPYIRICCLCGVSARSFPPVRACSSPTS